MCNLLRRRTKSCYTTAQAFAKESSIIIISGAPGIKERLKNPLLHHKVKDFDTQKKIFENITIDSVVLDNPKTAVEKINKTLSNVTRHKKPVYIELPRDMALQSIDYDNQNYIIPIPSLTKTNIKNNKDDHTLINSEIKNQDNNLENDQQQYPYNNSEIQKALDKAISIINVSVTLIIIVGIEIQRFNLQKKLLELIDKTNIPFVSTILSKSVLGENHPLFFGVYERDIGSESVCQYVESSNCLLLFDAPLTETDFSMTSTHIDKANCINVTSENLLIKDHKYDKIFLQDFIESFKIKFKKKK
jgi:indolepyruvate decarboxylase